MYCLCLPYFSLRREIQVHQYRRAAALSNPVSRPFVVDCPCYTHLSSRSDYIWTPKNQDLKPPDSPLSLVMERILTKVWKDQLSHPQVKPMALKLATHQNHLESYGKPKGSKGGLGTCILRAPHVIQACEGLSLWVPVEKHLDYLDFQSSLWRSPCLRLIHDINMFVFLGPIVTLPGNQQGEPCPTHYLCLKCLIQPKSLNHFLTLCQGIPAPHSLLLED